MALHGYFGLPRAGKTYGVVEHVVIPSLQEGRHVITNIPLEGSTLTSVFGGQVTQLPSNWFEDPDFADSIPKGVVLILDEVWRKWPAGQSVNKVPICELALLKEHGHRVDSNSKTMRVVLVTQDPSDLASWTRRLIDVSFRMEKLQALGLSGRYRVDIYKRCPTGENPPKRLLIRQATGTYKPDIYQYYRTATVADVGNVGDETVADRRGSIWRSPWLILCILVGFSFPILGVWGITDFFSQDTKPAAPTIINPPPPVAPAPLVNPPPAPAASSPSGVLAPAGDSGVPGLPVSQSWRVGGLIKGADEGQIDPPIWDSLDGYNSQPRKPISKTTRVALIGPYGVRYVSLSMCEFYSGDIDVYCDIDGERITPWSGQGHANGLVSSGLAQAQQSVGVRTEQSVGRTPMDAAPSKSK